MENPTVTFDLDTGQGWHWTAAKHYPYLYRNELSGWVYLLKSSLLQYDYRF